MAESFLQPLKREPIKRQAYALRGEARAEVFDYTETFSKTQRCDGYNHVLSPEKDKQKTMKRLEAV